ncbi:MAG: sensor histidine kinase [Rhodospirillales bacterium]|jgi:signal transduction histidine kinase|nr:sensor histidine kinase [Rhodospirillales bacterium]
MLKNKISIVAALCCLLSLGFLVNTMTGYFVAKNSLAKFISEISLPLTGDNIYSEIQRDLLQPTFISSLMAQDTFVRDWALDGELDQTKMIRFLDSIQTRYNSITAFYVSESTKRYYHSSGVLKVVNENDPQDEWYFRVRDMPDPFEVNVDVDTSDKKRMTVFINYKVFGFEGEYLGAIGIGLDVSAVKQLIDAYQERYGRNIYFADKGGVIKLHSGKYPDYMRLIDKLGISKHANKILENKNYSFTFENDGRTVYVNSRFIEEFQWYLVAEQDGGAAESELESALMINVAISLIVTLVMLFTTWIVLSTHQRQLDNAHKELKAANKAKSGFLANMSHEIRTPLNAIIGFGEVMRQEIFGPVGSDKNKEYISDIVDSSNSLLGLISDILDLSKVEAGKLSIIEQPMDLQSTVDESMRLVDGLSEEYGVKVEVLLDDGLPLLLADSFRVKQMLINLVSNSIKYTPRDGTVVVKAMLMENNSLVVSVKDSGVGMSSADLKIAMLPFKQVGESRSVAVKGTGLGLPLVMDLMELHNGTLEIVSEPGKGTLANLIFPAQRTIMNG